MFKVGDRIQYLGKSFVFEKSKVYGVEMSNSHFFCVNGSCFSQENTHWVHVGVVSLSTKDVKLAKSDIENHPHKEAILAYAAGEKVQYYCPTEQEWQDIKAPSFYLVDNYRVKPTVKPFQISHKGQLHDIKVTFVNNQITAISAV